MLGWHGVWISRSVAEAYVLVYQLWADKIVGNWEGWKWSF